MCLVARRRRELRRRDSAVANRYGSRAEHNKTRVEDGEKFALETGAAHLGAAKIRSV